MCHRTAKNTAGSKSTAETNTQRTKTSPCQTRTGPCRTKPSPCRRGKPVQVPSRIHKKKARSGPLNGSPLPLPALKAILSQEQTCLWLLAGISWYLGKGCSFEDAAEFAMDDCMITQRLRPLIFQRRAVLKKAVLRCFQEKPA